MLEQFATAVRRSEKLWLEQSAAAVRYGEKSCCWLMLAGAQKLAVS